MWSDINRWVDRMAGRAQADGVDTCAPGAGVSLRVAAVLAAVAAVVACLGLPCVQVSDSEAYIAMAQGHLSGVAKPFANRILQPFLVQTVVGWTGMDMDVAFLVVGFLGLLALVVAVACLTRSSLRVPALVALLVTPCLYRLLVNVYLPDLFHAALASLFLLALHRRMFAVGLVLLFVLQLARESTIVLTFVVTVLALWRRHWWLAAGAVAASLAGIAAVGVVTASAQPNVHHLGGLLYLIAKVPANGMANILGLVPWTDTFRVSFPDCYPADPLWRVPVPGWLAAGGIHEVGIYRFDLSRPVQTAICLLTTFGILPVLAWNWTAGRRQWIFSKAPFALVVALLYGLLAFAMGPVSGTGVDRLVGYGWPAFWIAVPALLWPWQEGRPLALPDVWVCHAFCCWLPVLVATTSLLRTWQAVLVTVVALILQAYVWRRTRRTCVAEALPDNGG